MSLAAGTRLGPYEVLAPIGAGGMGEVFRGRDTSLNREVAIKVLPAAVASDPDRLARFEREAQALAALNHPNIAHIYGLEKSGPTPAIIMEFVGGEDLSARIKRGPIRLAEALPLARQIAEALAAAHEAGIIHRDLKPANIKVTDDGTVKVLDFGLAKALDPSTTLGMGDAANSPTLTNRATQMGVILGTAAYMSPEQARGKAVDKRADIWAFGVVLHEMLTGRQPFVADNVSEVLAHVLTKEPEWNAVPPDAPSQIRELLRHCLAKEARLRLHDIADAKLAIDDAMAPRADSVAIVKTAAPPARGWSRRGALALATLMLLGGLAVGGFAVWQFRPVAPPGVFRFTIDAGSAQLDNTLGQLPRIAVAPSGRALVYGEGSLLSLREFGSFASRPLEGTADAVAPAFSPDGRWLVFGQGGRIRKVALAGGQVMDVASANFRLGAFWSADDYIYFSAGLGDRGIWRVPAGGGQSEQVTRLGGNVSNDGAREQAHGWPQVLPNGRDLLYSIIGPSGGAEDSRIVVETIGSGVRQTLVERSAYARYVAPGHIVYSDINGALMAIRYDADTRSVEGLPFPASDERVTTAVWGGRAVFDASADGVLVYVPETPFDNHVLVNVDHAGGDPRPVGQAANMRAAMVGPDGRSVAVTVREPGRNDIWLLSTSGKPADRLTFDSTEDEIPVWDPTGRRVVYSSAWAGEARRLMVTDVFVRGTPKVLRTWARHIHPTGWSPDGKWLATYDYHPTNNEDIWVIAVDSNDSVGVATSAASELNAVFSPDGHWLAYQSSESGRYEIYVTEFPGLSNKRQVSNGGGTFPRWEGTGLYFLRGTQVMAIPAKSGGVLGPLEQTAVLFDTKRPIYEFDSAADRRFLLLLANAARINPPIHVVLNWFETLRPQAR